MKALKDTFQLMRDEGGRDAGRRGGKDARRETRDGRRETRDGKVRLCAIALVKRDGYPAIGRSQNRHFAAWRVANSRRVKLQSAGHRTYNQPEWPQNDTTPGLPSPA